MQMHSESVVHSLSEKIACYCCCRWTRTKTETEKDGYKVSVMHTLSLNQNYLSLMCSHIDWKIQNTKARSAPRFGFET